MLFRLLILGILGFVIYRAVRSWLTNTIGDSGQGGSRQPDRVDDEMIKDPVCGTYFAQRNGVALTTSENVLYFCSTECRDSYKAQQSKSQ
jgi:YHS domain-containing protein